MFDLDVICQAIRARRLLAFKYGGFHRIVAPYCHGASQRDREVLRGVQIGGLSRSGGFGFGKLWLVKQMSEIRMTNDPFIADDPQYNPDDKALLRIHCRV